MAIYRKINTTFWSDPFICDLDPDKKLFYLYILTNERTKQCGIYDISKRQISFDLSISIEKVTENINFFTEHNKIMFSEKTNEIAIKNWERFNGSTSPKVIKCVNSELKLIKNTVLIKYLYNIDTVSQQEETPTQEETQEQAPTPKEVFYKIDNNIFSKECKAPSEWMDIVAKSVKIKPDSIPLLISNFDDNLIIRQEQKKSLKEYKEHFANWLLKQDLSQFSVKQIGKTNQI